MEEKGDWLAFGGDCGEKGRRLGSVQTLSVHD